MLNRKSRYRSKNSQFEKKSFKKTERGYSLLELTTVIFPLLILVVGAIDVTRVVQSYRALSEGVETALRCAYPVNGECQQVSAAPPAAQFNWYRFANVPTVWGDSFFYGSSVNTLQRTDYQFDNFDAEILGSVTYNIPAYRHYPASITRPAVGSRVPLVIMTAEKPMAEVNSPSSVNFHYENSPSQSYSSEQVFTSNAGQRFTGDAELEITGEGTDSGSVTFTVRKPANANGQGICYQSDSINLYAPSGNHEVKGRNRLCPPNYQEEGDVVIWIKGDSSGSTLDSTAVVDLSYRKPRSITKDGETRREQLGGVKFARQTGKGGARADFVPRGSGEDFTSKSNYEESIEYKTVRVRYGEPTRLNFHLRRAEGDDKVTTGDAKWKLTEIRVYTPEFIQHGQGTAGDDVECEGGIAPSADPNDLSACKISDSTVAIDSWKFTDGEPTIQVMEDIDLGLTATEDAQLDPCPRLVKKEGLSPSMDACGQDFTTRSVAAHLPSTSINCEKSASSSVPYGMSDKDIKKAILSGGLCEIKATKENKEHLAVAEPVITNLGFISHNVVLNSPIVYKPVNCSSSNQDVLPETYLGYHRIDWDLEGANKILTPQAIQVTIEDPDKFRETNDYNCDDFAKSEPIQFNKDTKSDEPDSFFAKPQADLGSDFEEDVRKITYAEGIDSDAYVHVDERIKDKPIQLPGIPSDPSISYWFSDTQDLGAKTIVAGSPFPKGTVPEVCKDPSSFCRAELESLPLRDEADFEVLTEQAELLGYQEMQLAYPSARPGCDEPGCVSLELSAPDTNNMINAEATMKVPLATLFGNDIEISFTDSERWEGHFAGNAN